jgi:hypothetical protein
MPDTGMAAPSRVVSVRFLGFLHRVAGRREMRVTVSADATVDDLIRTLAGIHGDAFREAIFRAPGEAHTHLRIFLDGDEASLTDRIASGDSSAEVALLVIPGFEGGS